MAPERGGTCRKTLGSLLRSVSVSLPGAPSLPFPSAREGVSDEDGVDEMFTGSLGAGAAEVIDELENFGKT